MKWKNKEINDSVVAEKSIDWKTSKILTRLLLNKNLKEKKDVDKFINPNFSQLRNPFEFENMELAVDKVIEHKNRNERIYIYGDYDVDGITATAFLVLVFRSIGIDTKYYIPNRMEDTYGLDKNTIDFIDKKKGKMIITVDTGANSIEDIRYAKSLGIDIVVTDHHRSVKEKSDEEYILINPRLSENYKFKYLSGAGVALKFAQAVYEKLNISKEKLYEYLDIVMIGTVADVVPMIDENRVIISKGLEVLKRTKVKGLVYLMRYLKFQNKLINTTDVSYFIAPLINSLGRIGMSKIGADFFIEEDEFKIYNIIEEMKKHNKIRRRLEKKIYDEAIRMIEHKKEIGSYIFLSSKEWHPGVIGIISSRLSIKYGVPVILVAVKNGIGKASCRSSNGINIFNIFKNIKTNLIRFGGHDLAAGFIAKKEKLKEIERGFSEEIQNLKVIREEKVINVDLELSIDDINEEVLKDIKILSPYGLENNHPVFMDKDVCFKNIEKFGVENRHFNGIIYKGKKEYNFIAFNLSNEIKNNANEKYNILYFPEKIIVAGIEKYNIRIKSIK